MIVECLISRFRCVRARSDMVSPNSTESERNWYKGRYKVLRIGIRKRSARYHPRPRNHEICSYQMRLAPKPISRHAKSTDPNPRTRYCLGQLVFCSALISSGYLLRSLPNLSSVLVILSMMAIFGGSPFYSKSGMPVGDSLFLLSARYRSVKRGRSRGQVKVKREVDARRHRASSSKQQSARKTRWRSQK